MLIFDDTMLHHQHDDTQRAIACSKLTIETLYIMLILIQAP